MVIDSTSSASIAGPKLGERLSVRECRREQTGFDIPNPRMEHSVAFVEPSGLRVHQVLHGTPGNGAESILDEMRTNLADRTGLMRSSRELFEFTVTAWLTGAICS